MEKNLYNKMVKRTVMLTFGLWLTLFIISVSGFYYTYGEFNKIHAQKGELLETMQKFEKIKKNGLDLKDFKSSGRSLIKGDKNLENIMNIIEEDFYDKHFKNTSAPTYDEFINEKVKEINEKEGSEIHGSMEEISSTILPSFIENGLDFEGEDDFSELKFVNYVERIMQTFNLEYSGEIGIADVLPLEVEGNNKDKGEVQSNEELLASKIFYIPVNFGITGSKASIIDFIYFIENVGKVNVEENVLSVNSNDFFKKSEEIFRNSDLRLEGDTNRGDYNIYLNQMVDIESITFGEYIYNKRDGDKSGRFIANIRKSPQGFQKYEAQVTLRFYVKGISDYKIEKKYKDVIANLLEYIPDIKASQGSLSTLKSDKKTPEVALLIKKLVTYEGLIIALGAKSKEYGNLKTEEVYDDILTSMEIERKLISDLTRVASIAGLQMKKLDLQLEEDK